jgi:hypothetical protein
VSEPRLDLFQTPVKVAGSMTGTAFSSSIQYMGPGKARELALYQQYSIGNVPSFLRRGIPIDVNANGHAGVFWAMPDYLSIGEDDNFFRTPMCPGTAQKIADLFEASLPTRKMVNDIWKQTTLHVSPKALDWKGPMRSVQYYVDHNDHIQRQLAGRSPADGVAGHKKDIVIARGRPQGNVAIYGWHQLNGQPIQGPPIQMTGHDASYEDYSHGVRLVASIMEVDGDPWYIHDVLIDDSRHFLLSDEGKFGDGDTRYPT